MEAANDAGEELMFACPECGSSLLVNAPMRDTLMENGCVICGSEVTGSEFESTT